METVKIKSWEVSDSLWERVEVLILKPVRDPAKTYRRKSGAGLAEFDDLEGIAWEWQSIDGAMMKAPLAQETVGPNPMDREKTGASGTC